MSTINLPLEKSTRTRWLMMALVLVTAVAAVVLWMAWPITVNRPAGEATQQQALWQSQEIDSYRYTLAVSCFCIQEMVQPVTIEVKDGELASITYVDSGEPADAALFERYTSVDKLYAIITDAESQNPARLDIVYDPATGVPLDVDIDISETMADEEIRFAVTEFEALP